MTVQLPPPPAIAIGAPQQVAAQVDSSLAEELLVNMVLDDDFADQVFSRPRVLDWFAKFPVIGQAAELLHNFAQEYGCGIPKASMIRGLLEWGLDAELVSVVATYWYSRNPAEYSKDDLLTRLNTELTKLLGQALHLAATSEDRDLVQESLSRLEQLQSTGSGAGVSLRNPFEIDPSAAHVVPQKVQVGIPWFDSLTGGGLTPGESFGIIMPSKTGKTTIAWQTIMSCIKYQRKALLVSTEQKLEGDLSLRAFVLATDSTRDDWKKQADGRIPPALRTRWEASREAWQEYMRMVDAWIGNSVSLPSIRSMFAELDRLCGRFSFEPEVFILDWWGSLLRKIKRDDPSFRDNFAKDYEQNLLQELHDGVQERQWCGYVFHQLAGAEAAKSARHVSNTHNAQGNKDWNNYFDYCAVSSKRDEDGHVTLVADASRTADQVIMKLKLDGPRCRFVPDDADHRRFVRR